MDFFGKLNAKNTFGMFEQGKGNNIINIICGVLLIILIIVLIVCLVRKNDNFSNQKENNNDLSDCEILMFDREGCGFSKKMKEVVKNNNNMIGNMKVCVVDMIKHPDLAKKYNANATPHFVLKDDSSIFSMGFAPLEVHENKLKSTNNTSNTNSNSKRHKLVGRSTCPFCMKAYQLLDELNVEYDKIDSNSPEGVQLMKNGNNGEGVNGVPYMLCSDAKEIIGFNEQEIRNLKN